MTTRVMTSSKLSHHQTRGQKQDRVKEAGIKDLARVDHDPLKGGKVGGSSRWSRRTIASLTPSRRPIATPRPSGYDVGSPRESLPGAWLAILPQQPGGLCALVP